MSARLASSRPSAARRRPLLGGWLLLVLFLLQSACATGRSRSPQRHVTLTPDSDFSPVQVSNAQFRQAFTQLVLDVPLRIAARPTPTVAGRLVLVSWPPGGVGDFRVELSSRDRFVLALSLALTPTVEAAIGELQDFTEHAMTTLLTGLSLYLLVLMAPEPISKGLALAMTLLLWSYLGQELWDLISATKNLWDASKVARSFLELRDASEQYALVLGPNTLRVLLLLATWKAGAKANEAMTGSGLPGFPLAVRNAAHAGRFRLPTAASDATSVSVAEGRLVLTLPSGAGALFAMQSLEDGELHHIATVENEKSPARGGPWTPKLKELFDKAGMSMEDAANKVRIPGHQGPHPREYHERVFQQLKDAVRRCKSTAQCREALTRELKNLADELQEVGSELNRRVTRTQ